MLSPTNVTPELHPAIGRNRYCGPAALSIITGLPTDETAKAIRGATGKRAVFGVHAFQLLNAASALGVSLREIEGVKTSTLASFVKGAAPGRYLVNVTGHYVVVRVSERGAEICDNSSVYPKPFERFKKQLVRIKRAWRVADAERLG